MLNEKCPISGIAAKNTHTVRYRGHEIAFCSADHAARIEAAIDTADRAVSDLPLKTRLMGYRTHAILLALGGLAGVLLW